MLLFKMKCNTLFYFSFWRICFIVLTSSSDKCNAKKAPNEFYLKGRATVNSSLYEGHKEVCYFLIKITWYVPD
jgi:hypothetical protein